jgi:hypothetical protein
MSRPSAWRLDAMVSLVRSASNADAIERLHAAIQREVASSARCIDEAAASGDTDFSIGVIDDECDHVEELLGLAFVVAQTFIARLRSRIALVSRILEEESGKGLSFVDQPTHSVVLARGPTCASSAYTEIEVINAVANYWKHQESWLTILEPKDGRLITVWKAQPKSPERRTIEIVTSIGLKPGCSGNLRAAASALGVSNYMNLTPIRDKLTAWGDELFEATRLEIAGRCSNTL